MSERLEQTWVVRRSGMIGPAVTIPADNKPRSVGFAEGLHYLREKYPDLATLKDSDFECSLHKVPLGPVLVKEEDRKKKFES